MITLRTVTYRSVICLTLGIIPLTSVAAPDNCQVMGPLKSLSHLNPPADLQANKKYILADQVTSNSAGLYTFQGDVHLFQNNVALSSDKILYKEFTDTLEATGDVNLKTGNSLFFSDRLFYQLSKEAGQLDNASFFFPEAHASGKAARLNLVNKDVTELSATTYTTCDGDRPAWQLHAEHLTLDTSENIGIARNVWIDFMRVPILYFPYLSFPLSGRKTGLLVPTFGSSSRLGTKISVPYYLNLAPDLDATVTLENYTARGQRLLGELRFLNEYDDGQIDFEYLPDDKKTQQDRNYLSVIHKSKFLPHLTTNLQYRRASDKDYFDDFGNQLTIANVVHLESKAEAIYQSDNWSVQSRVVQFQTLDKTITDSARPYKILPEISFEVAATETYYALLPEFNATYIHFDGKDRVSGGRLDLQPSISLPFEGAPGFFIPKLSMRHTQYSLDKQAAGADDSPSRTLSIFSVDSGLFFERELALARQPLIQTLEPRLFFLNVPFKDQSRLIIDENNISRVFDTSLASQSFTQIFSENRFTGGDRVGDTRQLTMALTTRFLDAQTGIEKLSASIGRIRYFRDRKVGLPGAVVQTQTSSDYFSELRAKPFSFLNVNVKAQWNSEQDTLRSSSIQLQYSDSADRLLNFGYLTARDDFGKTTSQESDVSIFWPISHNWNFIGRRNYNHFENRSEEKLAGLEYSSCCWAFRMVTRRYVLDDGLSANRSILFQFELKGLAAFGRDVKSLLRNSQNGISGY